MSDPEGISQDLATEESSPIQKPEENPMAGPPVSEIPNGGYLAWLQVFGSFMLWINTWGIVNTFGVYQTYYETAFPNESASSISWIGSLQGLLLLIVTVVTGPLYDAGYFRELLVTGSFLVVFGMMMTSLCKTYWQAVLAQGLCVGLGSGALFIPCVAIVGTYFSTKKSLATGIAATGSSIGGIIYPIVFHRLQPQIGFPWATRVLGFLMLATLAIPLCVMRMRIQPAQKRPLFDIAAVKEPAFILFALGTFFGFMGIYIPFFYLPTYAVSVIPKFPVELSVYTIAIINASSTLGRLIPNYIADKIGPLNVLVPCAVAASILAYCWVPIKSEGGLIVFCLLYGFFTGAFISLPPSTVITLSPRLGIVGSRMGMVFFIAGLGLLVGSPVAGAILGSGGDFLGLQLFCATTIIVAAVVLFLARVARLGLTFYGRA